MHFWIDKRSQACGFNGRHGVPASLASGRRRRRRNKSMITPVHRFQSIENSTVSEQFRRPYQQPEPQHSNNDEPCQSPVLNNEPVNESIITRASPTPELEVPVYIEPPYEAALHVVPQAQLMKLGGLTKYGMWASFGLTTVSVAATKFYVDHQGTFEILLLCTLGALSVGLLVSCVLTVCKRSTPQQFINVQAPQPQNSAIEIEIPEMTSQRDIIISPMSNVSHQATTEERTTQDFEQPPPPYHIAILLPLKDNSCADYPPPTYENAVRVSNMSPLPGCLRRGPQPRSCQRFRRGVAAEGARRAAPSTPHDTTKKRSPLSGLAASSLPFGRREPGIILSREREVKRFS